MSTLIELNALRTAAKMKPLKAWKESKAKLVAAIAKLTGIAPSAAKVVEVTKIPAGMTAKKVAAEAAKAAKPAKTAKVAKEKTTTKPAAEGMSVSTLAEQLGIDPRVARSKLRRAFPDRDPGERWVFTTEKQVAEIRTILVTDNRKK
jgi:hypothetical protein